MADEVRNLAQCSSGATGEIQQFITRLRDAANESARAMRDQLEHAERAADRAQAAAGALAQIAAATRIIASRAAQTADATARQGSAVGEIREHGERIHELGNDTLQRIGNSRAQGQAQSHLGWP